MNDSKKDKTLTMAEVDSLLSGPEVDCSKWDGIKYIDRIFRDCKEDNRIPSQDEVDSLLGNEFCGEMTSKYYEKAKILLYLAGIEVKGIRFREENCWLNLSKYINPLFKLTDYLENDIWIGFSLIDNVLQRHHDEGKLPEMSEIDCLLGMVSSGEVNTEYFTKAKSILELVDIKLSGLFLIYSNIKS
jgi:hypothetical protein